MAALGSSYTFWSWDFAKSTFHQVSAVLQRTGQHIELYVESDRSLSSAVLDNIVQTFDNSIIGREHQAFGMEPYLGIDGNPRVTLLMHDIRDSQYYGQGGGLVGGYFWAVNEYLQSDLDQWFPGQYKSNEREMIFVDVLATIPGSTESNQVIAHEFQHMIHWLADCDEEGWLNEGFSDLATQLSGLGMVSSHVQSFLNNVNNNLLTGSSDVLGDFGAFALFSLYIWENYGGDAMTYAVTSNRNNGVASLDEVLASKGYSDRFADAFVRWTVANFLDDAAVSGYNALDIVASGADSVTRFQRPRTTRSHTAYPVAPVTLGIAAWAANYVTFGGSAQGDLVVTVTAGTSADFTVSFITSTSSTFTPGTNVRSVVSVPAGTTTTVTLPGLGSSYAALLMVPAHVSSNADPGQFTYQARLVSSPAPTPTPTPATTPAPTSAQRMNSGGPAKTDSSGNEWQADTAYTPGGAGYVGGSTYSTGASIAATQDDALYQTERWGMSAYKFPVPNGTFVVTLKFAELYYASAGQRVFDVKIEDRTVLSNFDIFAAAGAKNRAYDRTFTTTVSDGELTVSFIVRKGQPKISAILVAGADDPPATPTPTSSPATPTPTPSPATPTPTSTPPLSGDNIQRVNVGGPAYTDSTGNAWSADQPYVAGSFGYVNGQSYSSSASIANTVEDRLYQTERWGLSSYRFDVPNGTYRVTLHFAELYYSSASKRVFDVKIEGRTLLSGFDVYAAAGGKNRAYDRTFSITVSDGQLTIVFMPRVGSPKVNAISVVPASS